MCVNNSVLTVPRMERKAFIKVECDIEALDLDILGFIDCDITVNIIKDGEIVEK